MKNSFHQLQTLTLFLAVFAAGMLACAQTTTWSGLGADLNWTTAANWTTVGGSTPPAPGDTAVFGNGAGPASTNAAGAVNNLVSASTSVSGLSYVNVSPNFHTTQIDPGQTLTVNGTVGVGVAGVTTVVNMTGTGNFTVNNIAGKFNVGGNGISTATVTLTLPDGTNTINAQTLSLGESASNNGRQCIINLGASTNIINADNVNMGTGKGSGNITWLPATTTGRLVIRNAAGTGRATLLLGNGSSGSGSSNGRLLLAGHPADILASTLTLGKLGNDTGTQVGILTLDNGIVDTTSLVVGDIPAAGVPTGNGHSGPCTISIGGDLLNPAILIVNSPSGPGGGRFLLSDSITSVSTHTSSGIFNVLPNGTALVYCSITKTQVLYNTAAIHILGGTLNMEGAANTMGTPAIPIDSLSLSNATLQLYENGSSLNATVLALTVTGTNLFNISLLPIISSLPTVIPIVSYTSFGSTDSDPNNLLLGPLPGSYTGYLTNDNLSSISLVITNGPIVTKPVQWGGSANNNWDTTSLNWTNAGSVVRYAEGDFVTFDDMGKTNKLNLSGTHTPGSLTVTNNSLDYTFSGSGAINGLSSLVKSGTGSLTLAETGGDGFAGAIFVHGGTLVMDNGNSVLPGGLTNDPGTVVQIGNSDGNGALPAGVVQINGSLVFNLASNRTVSTVITGSGSLTQRGNGRLALTAANAYTGTTAVENGTLALSGAGSVASALTTVRNATLDITPATTPAFGALILTNGTFNVGTNPASMSALSLSNATIILTTDYANVGGAAILTAPSLSTGASTNTIQVTAINNLPLSPPVPFSIPLIAYTTATFNGGFNLGWNKLPGIGGYLTNNTVSSTIDLVVISAPQNLTWNGGSATGNNWSDAANWSGTAITPLDALIFDGSARTSNTNDTPAGTSYAGVTFSGGASAFTLNGAPINLTGTMVNNSLNLQTLNLGLALNSGCALDGGAGGLLVAGGVTNTSAATVVVTNLNLGTMGDLWQSANGGRLVLRFESAAAWAVVDSTGSGALVQAGSVQLSADGGTVDFGTASSAPNIDLGFTTNGLITIDASPGIFNMNNGTARANSMTAGGNGTVNAQVNINGGTLLLGRGAFTAGGGAGASTTTITITNGSIISTNGGDFTLTQRSASTVNQSGGLLQCGAFVLTTGQTIGGNGIVNLNGGVLACTNVAVGSAGANAWGLINHNGGTFRLGSTSAALFKQSNLAPLTNIVQAGGAVIDTAGFSTTFNLPLLTDPSLGGFPDGGLTKLGAGTLTLSTACTYNGPTTVNQGTLLVSGSLDVGDVTVGGNGTLAGTGLVGGRVTVNGTLAPGNAATTGTLTVFSNVTFNASGTNFMKLNKAGATNDVLSVAGTLAYGGTLNLTNLAGTLAATDTFKLFGAGAYAGSFAHLVPAIPGPGLGWNTNTLATDGTLRLVTTVNTAPPNLSAVASGGQLHLTWPADHTGWRLQIQSNVIGAGLRSNWVDVAGSTSVNSVNVPINPAAGSVFYRLLYP